MFSFFSKENFSLKNLLLILVLINFAAGIYSLQYYSTLMDKFPAYLWIFIIDCPIFAVFFGLCVLLLIGKKLNPYLALLSIVGNIKYGFWSIFILTLQGLIPIYPLFILSHLLLVIECVIFFRVFSFRLKHVLLALCWFLFCDVLDYFFLLHPPFSYDFFLPVALFSFASTIVIVILVSVFFSKNDSFLPKRTFSSFSKRKGK